MPTTCRIIVALAAALLCSACGSTAIFRATFESDRVGALPNTRPPEDPSFDRIYLIDTASAGRAAQLAVIANPTPGSEKSLRYANVNVSSADRLVGFISTEIDAPLTEDSLFALWRGRFQGDGSPLSISFANGSGNFAALRLADGTISRFIRSRPGQPSRHEPVGSYVEGVDHFILISVDLATRTWRAAITQAGTPSMAFGPFAVEDERAFVDLRPALYMIFDEDTHGTASYVIDDILISLRPPEMPRP